MSKRSVGGSPVSVKRQHRDLFEAPNSDYNTEAVETWIACGKCATTLGLYVLAIRAFESASQHNPGSVDALVGFSQSLRFNDIHVNETLGLQAAIEKLNRSIESIPSLLKHYEIFQELAECYLLVGFNEQAHQAIQAAIQLNENNPSLWLLSAQTLIRAGARQHAANALNKCLSLLPNPLTSPVKHEFSQNDPSQNVEIARRAHAELAAIAAADGNIELSIKELTLTLSLPPPPLSRIDEHIALWCALVTAKERDGDIQGALEACEQAEVAVGNSPRILLLYAYLLLLTSEEQTNKGQRAPAEEPIYRAISLLEKVIDLERDPKNPTAQPPSSDGDFLPWYLMGKAYSLLDNPRAAYDSYQVALRRASSSPITWLSVGRLYLQLNQLSDALDAYSQALRVQIDENSTGTATAWDGLSCVYERCDDQLMDAADACARSALCYRNIGDVKNAQYFEDRSKVLTKASKKESPVPPLRDPPDVPPFFLRDLVALLPSERIAFVQGSQLRQQQIQQQLLLQPQGDQQQSSPSQAQVQSQHVQKSSPRQAQAQELAQQPSQQHTPQIPAESKVVSAPPQGSPAAQQQFHPPGIQQQGAPIHAAQQPPQPQQWSPLQQGPQPQAQPQPPQQPPFPQYYYQPVPGTHFSPQLNGTQQNGGQMPHIQPVPQGQPIGQPIPNGAPVYQQAHQGQQRSPLVHQLIPNGYPYPQQAQAQQFIPGAPPMLPHGYSYASQCGIPIGIPSHPQQPGQEAAAIANGAAVASATPQPPFPQHAPYAPLVNTWRWLIFGIDLMKPVLPIENYLTVVGIIAH